MDRIIKNMLESCESFVCETELKVTSNSRYFLLQSKVRSSLFNSLVYHNDSENDFATVLEKHLNCSVYIIPDSAVLNSKEILAAKSYQRLCSVFGMKAHRDSLPKEEIKVKKVTTAREFQTWAETTSQVYGFVGEEKNLWITLQKKLLQSPNWHHFLLDDVATASVYFAQDNWVHLANVATLADKRNQGYGRNVSIGALQFTERFGRNNFSLISSEMAQNVYSSIGFQRQFIGDYFERTK